MIDGIVGLLGSLLLATGLLLATVGLFGMFRRPEIFAQLHAAGIVTGPAVILVLLASLATGRAETITSALLVVGFVLVTGSLSTHVIADAAWRRRTSPAAARPREPDRVVIAYDGSPGADLACDLVASLPWPARTTIQVVGVQDADLPALTARGVDPVARDTEAKALDDRLRDAAERLRGSAPAVEWRRLAGEPADAIVEHARVVTADLVITGSRGLGYRSLVLGSVANDVIDRAPCPVLVARSPAIRSVLLATDGSEESAAAIDLLAGWPIFADLPVRVLSVTADEPADEPAGAPPNADRRRLADAATQRLIAAGRTAVPVVRTGEAVGEIVAEARPDELIVIGSRGRTGLTRALLGSVARGVLLSTETSVLIVRRDAAPADPTS